MPFWKKYTKPFFLLFLLSSFSLNAQELDFTVSVNADQVNTTERGIFTEMENAFERFLNDRVWTNDRFQNNEKVKGNIIITIQNQPSIGQFTANAQIQLVRPVYKSSYETLLLNFADRDWDFRFTLGQPMIFNENNFQSNLTSLLAYYAYIALGLDYDSFSPLGGADFYEKALNVVNNAQQGNGWGQFQNRRNRYWLLENLSINNQYEPVREAIYTYHRQGLDIMRESPDKTRANVLQALKDIQQVNRTLPNAILIISFLDAKSDELLNIFSDGPMNVRREAYNELLKLDPTRRSKYQQIVQN
ncbi:MAG: DUF4835 family protein [Roseivirga sp.]